MDLEADETAEGDLFIGLNIVNGQNAVQPEANVPVLAADDVVVPIVGFKNALDDRRVSMRQDFVPPRFVVKAAPVSFAHVSLITGHFKSWLLQPLAAELNGAIDEPSTG